MQVGGVPAVLKYLLSKGLLHGDCLTVTGKTLAENLEALPGLKEGQDVIQTLENPIKSSGHLQILYGNLAPEGCVGKITGKEGLQFKGPARVFDSEEDMLKALDKDPMSLKVESLPRLVFKLLTVCRNGHEQCNPVGFRKPVSIFSNLKQQCNM